MVAQEILNQLGGGKFIAMTGAKHLLDIGNGLQFKLPRFAGVKINSVRITLDASDTYTVEFGRVAKEYKLISKHDGIYADGLRALFTKETGLSVTLGKIFA